LFGVETGSPNTTLSTKLEAGFDFKESAFIHGGESRLSVKFKCLTALLDARRIQSSSRLEFNALM
jgi:hypothetical protein